MKKRLLIPLTAAMLIIPASGLLAATDNNMSVGAATINQQHNGWLGVYIRPMPRALSAQLSGLMPSGEGILVDRVENNSPAERAGIQSSDILLSLDDQKLYSPDQLTRLVASSNAGREVDIQLIRQGQVKTIKARIGQRHRPMQRPAPRLRPPFGQMQPLPRNNPGMQPQPKQMLAWDSFESVQVRTLADGRYHAEVSFKDRNNETKSFTFEGKKEEIIQQIQQQKDLPTEKRKALLNALNMGGVQGQFPFSSPFMQGNPFNDPFFRSAPFDDSFLRDPFFNNGYPPFRSPFFDRFMPPQPYQPGWPNRK